MSPTLKFRLSLMMFLEYFVPGATVPILSHYLKNHLHFEPYQVGEIIAMPAVAAFFAPFIMSHIADRFLSSERLLAACHLLAACVMLLLSRQTSFGPFLVLYFVYGFVFAPSFGLTNTIALHHVPDAKRDFGGIRMWGTAGWVVVAWAFGYLWMRGGTTSVSRLPHALYVSALASVVLAVYALSLPRSRVDTGAKTSIMYWNALKVFARPSIILLCVLTVVNSMVHQFYYFGMAPFLSQSGFENAHIMPAMSIGQISEVIVLGILGACLTRLGMKKAMIIGVLAQAIRYLIFAVGRPDAVIIAAIGMHGVCYAFFFTAGYIYVDHHSSPETRAGAQQLFTIMISGFGVLSGSLAAGWTAQYFTAHAASAIDFHFFWLVPAAFGLGVAIALAAFFKEEPARVSRKIGEDAH